MPKSQGWLALQTAIAAISVIVSIVVALTAYQVQDPSRLDALESRCHALQSQLRQLRRDFDASQKIPRLRPGRIGSPAATR